MRIAIMRSSVVQMEHRTTLRNAAMLLANNYQKQRKSLQSVTRKPEKEVGSF
jgi:hypothetical protein